MRKAQNITMPPHLVQGLKGMGEQIARMRKARRLLQAVLADAGWRTMAEGESDARDEVWDAYRTTLADYAEREIFAMPA
ncbi:MAG: hypothetical protein AB1591_03050, partial [Pseudomonadota bacterium]